MPGFPDKFMPFMDEPPGAHVSTMASGLYGNLVRRLRKVTEHTLDDEPQWRSPGNKLLTGYKQNWRYEGRAAAVAPRFKNPTGPGTHKGQKPIKDGRNDDDGAGQDEG